MQQGGAILQETTKTYMEISRQSRRWLFCQESQEHRYSVEQQYALSVGVAEVAWSQGTQSDDA